ncbi:hypothetical protein SIN8267_00243 [Sinobacterium norvegicum]|uniref:Uncharacterized protein n=1 Tax=Sinobacterium norvegicum TaxID=1641715 RepID=A0ABM9AB97_9GAMM|nr:hypothetical protein [Sinobacterium norvegicum]CAH0990158.1 hypothetical protein SIN8267_00243 [Sinobacterium norvegicum]
MTVKPQLIDVDNVEVFIAEHRNRHGLYCLEQKIVCEWLTETPEVRVVAIVAIAQDQVRVAVVEKSVEFILPAEGDFVSLVAAVGAVCIDLSKPLQLSPLFIPKPWGQEIWYTGVEQRGVCAFTQRGGSVAIPYLLALFPSAFNECRQLVLLKILDPLAEEVFGDLYFELHTKKQEVYVVTHIDKESWPAGQGAIRFGFNQQKLAQYASEDAFRSGYADAVKQYRQVRVEVDRHIDSMRDADGIALDEPVSAEQLKVWMRSIPAELMAKELSERRQMDAFTQLKPLAVGDVVKVPCYTPHALQHGVRTIEFQTPVYERLILSFAQKVLTQQHWDSERAIEMMDIAVTNTERFEGYDFVSDHCGEVIVDYDDFYVVRVVLGAEQTLRIDNLGDYIIVMSVDQKVCVNQAELASEQAVLLSALVDAVQVDAGHNDATMLICFPK